ncbi:hypothetical protein [Bacterioplanoides pacificum]|uniref:Periplasmic sensor domain-containing protein n=1 Tax=Bacterioplanoides pacificum TaxID=1171596 RepID=A0ABV7VQW7_9GAMM
MLNKTKEKRRRVGVKLLSYLLTFSFVVTLVTFSMILLSDYYRGINEYSNSISQIRTSYQQSISYSLWNFDTRQIDTQLEGILNFPGVVYVYIETENDLIHSAGDVLARNDQRHSFPLTYLSAGKSYNLGTLFIDINYAGLYQELADKALEILLTQFLKTFSVSVFVLFIVRLLITRRLKIMSHWADEFSLDNLDQVLDLKIKHNERDELDLVAEAINKMRHTLKQDVIEQEQAKVQLEDTKERLALAIDNAALGFCQYQSDKDRIQCNYHFAALLGATQAELEAMPHPMERLRDMIIGEHGNEQREKFNQLLFGRIGRLQTCLHLQVLSGEEKWLDVTIQIASYAENRPGEILICMVDKTKELSASLQAQELAISLENKVTKRTEELYEEQQRAKVNIQKLTQQLERLQQAQSNCLNNTLNQLILKQLQHNHQANLELIRDYLDIALNGEAETLDLSHCLQQWCEQQTALADIPLTFRLPLSLILDDNRQLIRFICECLITREPALNCTQALELRLALQDDQAQLTLTFSLQDDFSLANCSDPQAMQQPHQAELCEFIITSQMQGQFRRTLTDHTLVTDISFSLSRD